MKYITSVSFAVVLVMPILGCATPAGNQASGTQSLTRQEVRADLEDWQRSGLDALWMGETPDVYSPEYRRRLAIYERLRAARAQASVCDPGTPMQ